MHANVNKHHVCIEFTKRGTACEEAWMNIINVMHVYLGRPNSELAETLN